MSTQRWFNALCLAIGVLLYITWGYPLRERVFSGENDFMQLYCGARLVGTPDLYNFEACKELQKTFTREHTYYPSVYYSRPPFQAFLLKPLAYLPYHTAYWIWQSFSIAMIAAFLIVFTRLYPETIVLASLSVPLLINLTNAQDVGITMALAGFSVLLAHRNRDFLAGLVLSLAAIKFHFFVLVPLLSIVHRRWRYLAGGAIGGAILVLLSFLAQGLRWPLEYLATLRSPEIHLNPDRMPTLRNWAYFFSGRENMPLEIGMSLAVVGLYAYLAWRIRDFRLAFALLLPAGILIAHHAYSQDLTLLLLSIALFAIARAPKLLLGVTIAASLPPVAFLLLDTYPWTTFVPLFLLAIPLAALLSYRKSMSIP